MNELHRMALALLTGLVAGLSLLASPARADALHPHEDIRAAAAAAARQEWAVDGGRVDAVADDLDPRVRLARCEAPLAVSLPYARKNSPRVTAEVRCAGPRPWKLYVPVRLAIFQPVVVASRPVPRDGILTADDVSLAEMDTGQLDYGFLDDPDHAIGYRLRRPLAAGEPVTPGNLEAPLLVRRGQQVTLQAVSGGITVRVAGIARADGIRGQVIRVQNLSSDREVQGIVRSAKSVEVLLR